MGATGYERRKHWVAWEDMCYPIEEGGHGFRSINDITKEIHVKLWWSFRSSLRSLWSTYIGNKYYKRQYPVMVMTSVDSQYERSMLNIREEVEP